MEYLLFFLAILHPQCSALRGVDPPFGVRPLMRDTPRIVLEGDIPIPIPLNPLVLTVPMGTPHFLVFREKNLINAESIIYACTVGSQDMS